MTQKSFTVTSISNALGGHKDNMIRNEALQKEIDEVMMAVFGEDGIDSDHDPLGTSTDDSSDDNGDNSGDDSGDNSGDNSSGKSADDLNDHAIPTESGIQAPDYSPVTTTNSSSTGVDSDLELD